MFNIFLDIPSACIFGITFPVFILSGLDSRPYECWYVYFEQICVKLSSYLLFREVIIIQQLTVDDLVYLDFDHTSFTYYFFYATKAKDSFYRLPFIIWALIHSRTTFICHLDIFSQLHHAVAILCSSRMIREKKS